MESSVSILNFPLAPNPVLSFLSVGSRFQRRRGGFFGDKMKCAKFDKNYKIKCGEEAKRKCGNSWYCLKHARFMQIRYSCKTYGKAIPSYDALETLFSSDLCCPACGRKMTLTKNDSSTSVMTIQHDHNGELRLICLSCNSRHKAYPDDSYYKLPPNHKKCPLCNKILPYSSFNILVKTFIGLQFRCKPCGRAYANKWYRINKKPSTEKQKKAMREYYHKKKEKILASRGLNSNSRSE